MANELRTPTVSLSPGQVRLNKAVNTYMGEVTNPNATLISGLGTNTADAIQFAYKLGQTINLNEAKAANNDFITRANEILYDLNSGYFNKKGKDAVDGYEKAITDIENLRIQVSEGLKNPYAQSLFEDISEKQNNEFKEKINQFHVKAVQDWSVDTSTARVSLMADQANKNLASWNIKDGAFNKYYQAAKNEFTQTMALNGVPVNSEPYKLAYLQTMSEFHNVNLRELIDSENIGEAYSYMNKFKDEISANVLNRAKKSIKILQDKNEKEKLKQQALLSNRTSKDIKADILALEQWRAENLNKAYSDKTLTKEQRQKQVSIIEDTFNKKYKALQQENEIVTNSNYYQRTTAFRMAFQQMQMFFENKTNLAISDVKNLDLTDVFSPTTIEEFERTGIDKEVLDILHNGGRVADNSRVYNDFMTLPDSVKSNIGLAEFESTYISKVSSEQYKEMKADWERALSNNLKTVKNYNSYLVKNTFPEYFKTNASQSKKREAKAIQSAFDEEYNRWLNAFEQENKRAPTLTEQKNLAELASVMIKSNLDTVLDYGDSWVSQIEPDTESEIELDDGSVYKFNTIDLLTDSQVLKQGLDLVENSQNYNNNIDDIFVLSVNESLNQNNK